MKSNSNSAEQAVQALDNFILSIDLILGLQSLYSLYDSFIRDFNPPNLTHEERLEVHSIYRAL